MFMKHASYLARAAPHGIIGGVDPRHLRTLEFPKILNRLAEYASFSASADRAHDLMPAPTIDEARWRLETTTEARQLLEAKPGTTIGGARDVRPQLDGAERGVTLLPQDLLDVADTLRSAGRLHRTLTRLDAQFPRLASIAGRIDYCPGLLEEIERCLDDRGEVRDSASPELARIRRDVRVAHDRLLDKLQNIISSSQNAPYLQEAIITQREGRYVVPVKAGFKSRLPGVVHDVSASGATVFTEPLSAVSMNNTWRELQMKEEQEVHRILATLSASVADHAGAVEVTVRALAELDLHFAKARYADALEASAPELVPFRKQQRKGRGHEGEGEPLRTHPGSTLRLLSARHPLLEPETVVPIDVELAPRIHLLVITGPNTGGKTVTLKTVGLLTVMALAGMHIPVAEGSALSPFEEIYADIGDEQSIEQSLSTFSSHMVNILSFLDEVDERSLVLLDELGAGTDPAEGAALASALLDHFRESRATTLVATHYPELKSYAQLTPGVVNASVEFDPETLRPTYRLSIGLPGRSNALAIARQIGLPESLVEAARERVTPEDMRTSDMLADLHDLRTQAAQDQAEAAEARREVMALSRELNERLAAIDEERQEILEEAHREASAELETLGAEVRDLRRRMHASAAPQEELAEVEEQIDALETETKRRRPSKKTAPAPVVPREVREELEAGDTVHVAPLNAEGRVLSIEGDEAEVQVGPARTRVKLDALELRQKSKERSESDSSQAGITYDRQVASPGNEIDLRGRTVAEALGEVERYVDTASRAGLPWVRIIHGKGTGALRRAIRQRLGGHALISSYESGEAKEGGDGVTVAKLVQSQ
jgi:DNA mismatch repair protein MutS2